MESPAPHNNGSFATTRWTLVLRARDENLDGSSEAMERLCRAYWFPLYAFLRRQGCPPDDAQDHVQSFFSRLIARGTLSAADPDRGRFRSFLMTAVKNEMLQAREKARAEKRGGGAVLSLDGLDPEARYAADPSDDDPPERACDRRWAEALIEQTLARLREEHAVAGEADRFEALKGFLQSDRDLSAVPRLATRFGMSEAGIKSAIHRLRRRYALIFRQEVERTVASPTEADEEMRYLLSVLAT